MSPFKAEGDIYWYTDGEDDPLFFFGTQFFVCLHFIWNIMNLLLKIGGL